MIYFCLCTMHCFFWVRVSINFEFIFETFVNFEFNFEIFVNFEFIFEYFLSISSFLLMRDEVTITVGPMFLHLQRLNNSGRKSQEQRNKSISRSDKYSMITTHNVVQTFPLKSIILISLDRKNAIYLVLKQNNITEL